MSCVWYTDIFLSSISSLVHADFFPNSYDSFEWPFQRGINQYSNIGWNKTNMKQAFVLLIHMYSFRKCQDAKPDNIRVQYTYNSGLMFVFKHHNEHLFICFFICWIIHLHQESPVGDWKPLGKDWQHPANKNIGKINGWTEAWQKDNTSNWEMKKPK